MPRMPRWLGYVLLGWMALFFLLNLRVETITFFFGFEIRIPLAVALFMSALLGAGAVLGIMAIKSVRRETDKK